MGSGGTRHTETWVEEKGWEKVKGKLSNDYRWEMQWARRESKKGRAIGGMLMGVRKDMGVEGEDKEREQEGVIMGRIKVGKEI